MIDDFKKYLSVRDVAKKFGVTEEWIRDLIQTKTLKRPRLVNGELNRRTWKSSSNPAEIINEHATYGR